MNLSFDNTSVAFAHKTNKELKASRWLFKTMGLSWLVKLGTRITPWAVKVGLPIKGIIRKTIFKQFVGGETLEKSIPVCQKLAESQVEVILDYGVEAKEGEDNFEKTTEAFKEVIQFAATQTNVPFISIKVTGFARFSLLEKLDAAPRLRSGVHLSEEEEAEWEKVRMRMQDICNEAAKNNIGVLVDAEESWIQDPVDKLTMEMMEQFNREKAVVYNTIQLYRHDRLDFLKMCSRIAHERKYILGVKLVRGAYMEKEARRAEELNYQNPIQPNKEASDADYNDAVRFCLGNINNTATVVASHNEQSNLLAASIMEENLLPKNHKHLHFSQLYGMSDNITYNLAHEGFSVSKYLPFGPIEDVIPYLMRRAQENTSIGGQTSRELALILKELQRRKS
jgi:proline dehydrogenase